MSEQALRIGLIGFGMIVDETYIPCIDQLQRQSMYESTFGVVNLKLTAVATRTGSRVAKFLQQSRPGFERVSNFSGSDAIHQLLDSDVQVVCIATPDDRHFEAAEAAIKAGKHVLIEKPSVLNLNHLDRLIRLADEHQVLVKVVYHKLLDPDHKRLRTLVHDGVLQHVNNGYCSLLEPKSIAMGQFAEWIQGRNPATYVAVHYLKLIDFTFGPDWKLKRIAATGQRGLVSDPTSSTWDSVQLQVVYEHPDQREAAFDIHTSWVTPDNFPGYVEQEVQFRFDNAIWNAHQRKRGVEMAIEGRTPNEFKNTPNFHYNGSFLEPWNERSQRGYGIEVIQRFFNEVSFVEFGKQAASKASRIQMMNRLSYNDIRSDRKCVAIVQALEAILDRQAKGDSSNIVEVNTPQGGLVIRSHKNGATVLYTDHV
jgi:D-galacturonate reductase